MGPISVRESARFHTWELSPWETALVPQRLLEWVWGAGHLAALQRARPGKYLLVLCPPVEERRRLREELSEFVESCRRTLEEVTASLGWSLDRLEPGEEAAAPGPWRPTSWEAGGLQAHKKKALVPLPDNAPGWAGRGGHRWCRDAPAQGSVTSQLSLRWGGQRTRALLQDPFTTSGQQLCAQSCPSFWFPRCRMVEGGLPGVDTGNKAPAPPGGLGRHK